MDDLKETGTKILLTQDQATSLPEAIGAATNGVALVQLADGYLRVDLLDAEGGAKEEGTLLYPVAYKG